RTPDQIIEDRLSAGSIVLALWGSFPAITHPKLVERISLAKKGPPAKGITESAEHCRPWASRTQSGTIVPSRTTHVTLLVARNQRVRATCRMEVSK
ncbi:MAG: hypothetical protein AAFV88_05040, partial [Planctomycetota bacterium]